MATFVVDEDMPRSTAKELIKSGQRLNQELLKSLSGFKEEEIYGKLIIIEPGRIRVHRVQ